MAGDSQSKPLTPRATLSLAAWPAFLLVLNLFLFNPFAIYAGNVPEFDVSLAAILTCYALPATALCALFCLLAMFAPPSLRTAYIAALAALATLTWMQGNILLWDYGVLGKGAIDWSLHTAKHWVDAVAWCTVLLLLLIFHRRSHTFARIGAILLIAVQVIAMVVTGVRTPGLFKATTESMPSPGIYEFSSELNVVHVILDELQSSVFQDLIETDAADVKRSLTGFTVFQNTLGSFPTTSMSIPAIVGARIYSNSIPITAFQDAVYAGTTIASHLKDSGFTVDMAVPTGLDWHRAGRWSHFFSIPVPYGATDDERAHDVSVFVRQLSVLRSTPGFLKRFVLVERGSLPSAGRAKTPGEQMQWQARRQLSNKFFMRDLVHNMSVTRKTPTYKFIHLTTTHWPAIVDSEGNCTGSIYDWTWPNIRRQAKFGLADAVALIRRMQELGVYDRSLIILHADHGYWRIPDSKDRLPLRNTDAPLTGYALDGAERFAQIVCSSLPLLAIKPPGATGPLAYSAVPATLTDIPATLCSLLQVPQPFPGRSVFGMTDTDARERTFMYYDTLKRSGPHYFDRLEMFAVRGDPLDKRSWRFVTHLFPPTSGAEYETQTIQFGTDGTQGRHLVSGWGANERLADEPLTVNWALGPSAKLLLALPARSPSRLTARLRPLEFDDAQRIEILIDDRPAGTWTLTNASVWQTCSLDIPAEESRREVSTIEFRFRHYETPASPQGGAPSRAVMFESIRVE